MVCTRVDLHTLYAYVFHEIIKAIPYLERARKHRETHDQTQTKAHISLLSFFFFFSNRHVTVNMVM